MNLRIAIPLTMMLSFAVSCGLMIWNRRDQAQAPAARASVGIVPGDRLPSMHRSAPAEPPPAAPPLTVEAPRPVTQTGPSQEAKGELPIELDYRRSRSNPQTYVVTLMNKTEESMTLDVTLFDPTSKRSSQTQLGIEPMQLQSIGGDDGLDIEPGERITLRNPSYNDFVAEIRPR